MYQYDTLDKEFLADRAAEFKEQVDRRLAGEITEDQFKMLRLRNGLYLQLHAYMLRVAIPYGSLNAVQLRKLADHKFQRFGVVPQVKNGIGDFPENYKILIKGHDFAIAVNDENRVGGGLNNRI